MGMSLRPVIPLRDRRSSSLSRPARRFVSPSLSRMTFLTSRVVMMGMSAMPAPEIEVILISSSRVTSRSVWMRGLILMSMPTS